MVDLHIEPVIVVGKPDHDDLVHGTSIHMQRNPAPPLHLLVGILLTPVREVHDLNLPVLGGNQVLDHISVFIGSKAKTHGLKLLVSVINAFPERLKINCVILDVEARCDV